MLKSEMVANKAFRREFVQDLLTDLWAARFEIRHECHGIQVPLDHDDPAEQFDDSKVPAAWTTWLELPEINGDLKLAERDALTTDSDLAVCERQRSKRQSRTLHAILDSYWATLCAKGDPQYMALRKASGDVAKLQRILCFVVDGFEVEDVVDGPSVTRLRDLVLFFVHNPTSDSATGFNADTKKMVYQWYRDPADLSLVHAKVQSWNKLLVRTRAAKTLVQFMQTRRFYVRAHHPIKVDYHTVKETVLRVFESGDLWHKAAVLMFALGTRANELFRVFVSFNLVTKEEAEAVSDSKILIRDHSRWIKQIGCSKSGAAKLMLEPGLVSDRDKRKGYKPVLFGLDPAQVLAVIADLRVQAAVEFSEQTRGQCKELADACTTAISETLVQKLTRCMYTVFPDLGDACATAGHMFGGLFSRKVYSSFAVHEFPDSVQASNANQFISEILMHSPGKPTDSLHYATLQVNFNADADAVRDPNSLPRKRDPKHKPLFSQLGPLVPLKTKARETVSCRKFSHRRFGSEKERQQYFDAVQEFLSSVDVRPSILNMTAMGVSPQFQSARKKHKSELGLLPIQN